MAQQLVHMQKARPYLYAIILAWMAQQVSFSHLPLSALVEDDIGRSLQVSFPGHTRTPCCIVQVCPGKLTKVHRKESEGGGGKVSRRLTNRAESSSKRVPDGAVDAELVLAAANGHIQLIFQADPAVIVVAEWVLEAGNAGRARHVSAHQALTGITGATPASSSSLSARVQKGVIDQEKLSQPFRSPYSMQQ